MADPHAVRVALHLRVGPDLVAEPWSADVVARASAAQLDAVDGGLLIGEHDAPGCRPDLWDHLDGLLLAWIGAFDALAAGADEAPLEFPDTRIEADVWREADQARVRYEDIDTALPVIPTQQALLDAARRLVGALGERTAALRQLAARVSEESP